jgi:hypothetical protein
MVSHIADNYLSNLSADVMQVYPELVEPVLLGYTKDSCYGDEGEWIKIV